MCNDSLGLTCAIARICAGSAGPRWTLASSTAIAVTQQARPEVTMPLSVRWFEASGLQTQQSPQSRGGSPCRSRGGFPNACGAAGDAAASAFRRKLRRHRREIPQLAAAQLEVHCRTSSWPFPMVWMSNGRPRPAATRTLCFAAEQAASKALLSRLRRSDSATSRCDDARGSASSRGCCRVAAHRVFGRTAHERLPSKTSVRGKEIVVGARVALARNKQANK